MAMLQTLLPPEVIARLPTPKGVAMALTKACQREDVNLDTIASLVRTDPALSGRILALANSAASGGLSILRGIATTSTTSGSGTSAC